MRKTITLDTFRRVARAEETMMRSVMPRTSAADAAPLAPAFAFVRASEVARRDGSRLVKPAGFKLAEVCHA